MKSIRIIALLFLLGTAVAFSCKQEPISISEHCGCDGPTRSTVFDEQGTIEMLSISNKKIFRIVNKDKEFFFIACDTAAIASLQRQNKSGVRFSGNVKQFCDEPTIHLLPPIYYPIDLTKIQPLN